MGHFILNRPATALFKRTRLRLVLGGCVLLVAACAPMSLVPQQSSGKTCFYYKSSTAQEIVLVGDFNNWSDKKSAMARIDEEIWEKCLTLPAGEYEYGFIVDNNVAELPEGTTKVDDGFGGFNGYLTLE